MTHTRWIGACVLLLLTLCMFGDVLFTNRPILLSNGTTDIASMYIYWRPFAAEQLRLGRVPLWNPYVFCGQTIYGVGAGRRVVSAELDSISCWLLPRSINLGIVLHTFLAGLFHLPLALRRRLHPLAGITSAALFMFSGAYFLHVYAGHLMLLYGLAWTPLVLVSVDEWIRTRKLGWILLGMTAVAMQLFIGDLQGWFYTAIVCGPVNLVSNSLRTQQRSRICWACYHVSRSRRIGRRQLLTRSSGRVRKRPRRWRELRISPSMVFIRSRKTLLTLLGAAILWKHDHRAVLGTLVPVGDVLLYRHQWTVAGRLLAPYADDERCVVRCFQSQSFFWYWPWDRIRRCFEFSTDGYRD